MVHHGKGQVCDLSFSVVCHPSESVTRLLPSFVNLRQQILAVGVPLAGNGNTPYGAPESPILSAIFHLEPKV